MKFRTLTCIAAITLFAALAIQVRVAAQEQQQGNAERPQHYTVTDLGTLGGTFSDSAGIDNRHRIVGASTVASGQQHAYIFSKAKMTDLNELIPADSGWTLVAATGINGVGEIVGNGRINGQTHAFLLTPDDDDED